MHVLALPILVLMALGVIVGWVKPARVVRFVASLAFTPVLIGIAWGLVRDSFFNVPLPVQALMLLSAPLAAMLLFLVWLPRSIRNHVLGSAIYDLLRWLVTLPFRAIYALVRRI